jgi:ATP-binding cassette, subfamily G (WHITE), member 2, PDR
LAFIVFYCVIYVLATEFISEQKSKGEVLIFRRGFGPSQTQRRDEEFGYNPPLSKEHVSREKDFGNINRQTDIFHWEDVCYDVKIKSETRRILDHVDGWVRPGTLTALMVCFWDSNLQ